MTAIALGTGLKAGLAGPACLSGVLMLLAAPLVRGGNHPLALLVLEPLSLALLAALWRRGHTLGDGLPRDRLTRLSLGLLVCSPALLALVYLLPLPLALWSAAPGRAEYLAWMTEVGADPGHWAALSLVPQASWYSLLAGFPVLAAFLLGRIASLRELRWLAWTVLGVGLLQVLLGLLQIAGGRESALYFWGPAGRPIGSFGNSNHFANYLFMALMLCLWLAIDRLGRIPGSHSWHASAVRSAPGHELLAWGAACTLLLVGLLSSLSRGATLAGLPMAALALLLVVARIWRGEQGSRRAVLLVAIAAAAAVLLIGLDNLLARFSVAELAGSAGTRGLLARSTLEGAATFWPLGAGWGTYADVYPRFQPITVAGHVGHAHHDYAQLLFEGGAFFLLLAAAFAWLALQRALRVARAYWQERRLSRELLPVLICGLGLLGFLLHSLVEFNMRIPANAMLAALLAGVYLRPLPQRENAV